VTLGSLPKDVRKARELYEKSAAQGNFLGQYNLGIMYETGSGGLPEDEQKMQELYDKAEAQSDEYEIENL